MGICDTFRKSAKEDDSHRPRIRYGIRGEGIFYEFNGKEVEVDFTWINGTRIYTETIKRWSDRQTITDEEKRTILFDILRFTKGWFRKSIAVINTDDPSKDLWEEVCADSDEYVREVEYTSNQKNRAFERQMYLDVLNSKAGLVINGITIRSEQQLDEVLATLQKDSH